MSRQLWLFLLTALLPCGCIQKESLLAPEIPANCAFNQTIAAQDIPDCLLAEGIISVFDRDSANRVIIQVQGLRDFFRNDTGMVSFNKAADLARILSRFTEFYKNELFADSARFHRLIDHLLVAIEVARGTVPRAGGRVWPQSTPFLGWHDYAGIGVYFQPVETVQLMGFPLPRATAPTDSIVAITEHLYRYAIWRSFNGKRLPYWEYDFAFSASGVSLEPPWVSGIAQGSVLFLFTESFKRTGDQTWAQRARQVLNSMMISWDRGGVLLPDTSHGYWFEEYHPTVQVWNGGAQGLVGVGYYWQATGDTTALRIFQRGIDAIKYYTPSYDTGTWTLYSRIQGYNTRFYHNFEVQLLDQLYNLSGDEWFKTTADRWRAYVPPPGVT